MPDVTPSTSVNAPQSPRPSRVFIVDDSLTVRARVVEMLRSLPHVRVIGEAAAASEAIEAIAALRPDTVLLDLRLAGYSGMEVLRAVHERFPAIVFVVLTNHAEPQYRRACARAGASYFLDKSVEFERVRDVIAEIGVNPA